MPTKAPKMQTVINRLRTIMKVDFDSDIDSEEKLAGAYIHRYSDEADPKLVKQVLGEFNLLEETTIFEPTKKTGVEPDFTGFETSKPLLDDIHEQPSQAQKDKPFIPFLTNATLLAATRLFALPEITVDSLITVIEEVEKHGATQLITALRIIKNIESILNEKK